MNPDLTKDIAERLAKMHQSADQPSIAQALPEEVSLPVDQAAPLEMQPDTLEGSIPVGDAEALAATPPASGYAAEASEPPPDEIDQEFWKSFNMKGPEDLTPDKFAEISKKLQEFGRSLKRIQRHSPTTMGVMVPVKHRTPKKRKRKK